jgi:hypothetical protein
MKRDEVRDNECAGHIKSFALTGKQAVALQSFGGHGRG